MEPTGALNTGPEAQAGVHLYRRLLSLRVLLFCAIALVAVALRFAALNRIPPGVCSDEALNGNEGIHAVESRSFKVFYPTNNGREGLWINMVGISELIFGVSPFGLRFWSALVGSCTVFVLYLLGTELFSVRTALFSSWLLAVSFWHVKFSRIAFRAILVPLFLGVSIYLLLRALATAGVRISAKTALLATAGGFLYGLGFHSYIAYRFTPLVVILLLTLELHQALAERQTLRPKLLVIGIWLAATILTALPIGIYFLHHPTDFVYRARQVSIVRSPDWPLAFWRAVLRSLGQFSFRGDGGITGRSSLLLPPVSLLFGMGIALACGRSLRGHAEARTYRLLLTWFFIMLLPAILSGGPSGIRSIGTVVPVFLLAGLGANWIFSKLQNKPVACALFLIAILATGLYDAFRYFYLWPGTPRISAEFDVPKVEIGHFLNTLPPSTPRYLAVDTNDDDVRVPYRNSDGSELPLPVGAEVVLFETHGHPTPTILFEDTAPKTAFPAGSVIVQLYPATQFFRRLQSSGLHFRTLVAGRIPYIVVQ